MWKWLTSKPERIAAAIAFLAISVPFLGSAFYHSLQHSPVCHSEPARPDQRGDTFSLHADKRGTYDLQYQAASEEEFFPCFWGHTAEEWVALLTAYLVGFTSALAVFTGLLWWETRTGAEKQIRAASLTLRTARKQLSNAEIAHQRELRAYIGLSKSEVFDYRPNAVLNVRVEYENFGKTPAFVYFVWIRLRAGGTPLYGPLWEPSILPTDGSRFSIAPGTLKTLTVKADAPTQPAAMALFAAGHAELVAYGAIRYIDAFGVDRTTRFRLLFGGDYGTPADNSLSPMYEGNEAT